MIASGSGYTTLPTATISGVRFIALEDATDTTTDGHSNILFEDGGRVLSNIAFDGASATIIPFGDEIGVDPMTTESWNRFGKWLDTFETDFMWSLEELVELYERNNPKIEWWVEK